MARLKKIVLSFETEEYYATYFRLGSKVLFTENRIIWNGDCCHSPGDSALQVSEWISFKNWREAQAWRV